MLLGCTLRQPLRVLRCLLLSRGRFLETLLRLRHPQGLVGILRDRLRARERYDNGSYKESGTLYLRESLGATYSVIDVARQKDL